MGCLLVLFGAFVPRLATFFLWLARPALFEAAFGGILVPLLGIIFLPFTTLTYTLVFTPGVGLAGTDWIWVGLAFILDIAQIAASAADKQYQSGWRSE